MAVINTLATDALALRGADSEYHRVSRFFRDKGEAFDALNDGTWAPTAGVINVCLIGDQGLAYYDPDGDTADTVEGLIKSFDQSSRAYTDAKIAELVGDSPETLDTLSELASVLSNDPNYLNSLEDRIEEIETGTNFTGAITAPVTGNIVPFYFDSVDALPNPVDVHGAVAHAHESGLLYYAHNGQWNALSS